MATSSICPERYLGITPGTLRSRETSQRIPRVHAALPARHVFSRREKSMMDDASLN